VYIDTEHGVTVDDCARVSGQVGAVLDVEDLVHGHYTLEVSSPGLDRPLFVPAHYQRFTGRSARLQLWRPLEGQRGMRLTATLVGVEGDELVVETQGERVTIPVTNINKARLVPEN
jgi:ribosome maturation factor RimP